MALEVVDGELAEVLVGEALVALGAGVVEEHAAKLNFEPRGGVWIAVELDDDLCDSWGDNACVLLASQEHGLVLELGKLLIKFLYRQVVQLSNSVIIIRFICSFSKPDLSRAFNKQHIGLLVPVEGVDSEVLGAPHKDKRTLGVKRTIQPRTSGSG